MCSNLKRSVLIFLVLFFFSPLNLRAGLDLPFEDPEITISMDFQDAAIKDILKIFSVQSGLNFIASEGVQDRKVTLYMDKVGIKEAMDKLFKANNLAYELETDSNIFIVKDLGRPQIETVTKVFHLKYNFVPSSRLQKEIDNMSETTDTSLTDSGSGSSSSTGSDSSSGSESKGDIVKVIENLLTSNGKISEDGNTNSLIITDVPSRMSRIEHVIASLDVPQPQVLIEVEMLDVSKKDTEKLGIDWTNAAGLGVVLTSATLSTPFPFRAINAGEHLMNAGSSVTNGSVKFTNPDGNSLSAVANFLATQTDSKILARPKIMTLNNKTAELKIVTDEVVGTKKQQEGQGASSATTTEAERAITGVTLRVTPQISLVTNEITMFITPSVRDSSTSSILVDDKPAKDPDQRSTTSLVRVKDGETVVIGGLLRHTRVETDTKIPWLGDLPIIGAAFRNKNKSKDEERELVVFITPHIRRDVPSSLSPTKMVQMPEREQNTSLAIRRQDVISTSLNSVESRRKY